LSETLLDSVQIHFDARQLWLLNVSLAFVMFGIALEIKPGDFRQLLQNPRPVATGLLSQFLLLPLLTFFLVRLLSPMPGMALGMFMVAACPGGNVSNFITQLAGGNTALSVCLTAATTLLAIVMTPLNFEYWGTLYAPTEVLLNKIALSPAAMVELVFLLLGLPLLLGILVNSLLPMAAQRMSRFFRKASLLFFMFLIILALFRNWELLVEYIGYVFWLVLLHNILALSSGYFFARFLGNSPGDVRTIAIETGIQNSGLGLMLIFTFFDGMGSMALLAAFWGIWHLISGILLATFWGRLTPVKKDRV
jgi:BASS family bile acid:Na+ symporter